MDADRARAFLLTLPHTVETMQWGANLVFWTGDKAIGGKMFALINLDDQGKGLLDARAANAIISYSAGPERYSELLELEGMIPAPYLARVHWIAAKQWSVFRNAEWETELAAAHRLTFAKLSARTAALLCLSPAELKRVVAERRVIAGQRAEAGRAARRKPPKKKSASRVRSGE